MLRVNPRCRPWFRCMAAIMMALILAGISLAVSPAQKSVFPGQENAVYAEKPKNTRAEETIKASGQFVRSHKDLLKRAVQSLKNIEQPPDQIAAWIEAVPLTVGELEFRKGLAASAGPALEKRAVDVLFEEKVLLNEALKRKILPTPEEVDAFLAWEKKEYQTNPEYRAVVNLILKEWGLSEAEYWEEYEWYNAFRITMCDKLYKAVIKEAEEAGQLLKPDSSGVITPEVQEARESYWNRYTLELKKKADVLVNQGVVKELKFDRNFQR